jgi:N-acetylglutamate synthase-like GNAT family acetyltransferase
MTVNGVVAPRRARRSDIASARGLVAAAGLPLAGLDEHFDALRAVEAADGRLIGLAGTERYGTTWLLRSLVVDLAFRGRGIASALLGVVIDEARQLGADEIFLLTTDAHDFFAARGFSAVSRTLAPGALQASEELRGACPETATLMRLELAP